jgi:hypothetical protein
MLEATGVGQHRGVDVLREGQRIWVEQADGSQRAGIFVGEAEGTWFGGSPGAYVVYPDSRSGEEVSIMRVVPREDA